MKCMWRCINALQRGLNRIKQHLCADDGVGVVEIILILVVLIALVVIFKSQLNTLVNNIFSSINKQAKGIY
ncbi:MAG: Flp1 family type IVb pilin [Lachnospiraceae bacterium]|nr:Flp1 family type IVb pilin [Lachnospiraceae bacterium]